ncbi:hypothetical protein ABEB36_007326 [Hypothenemus hampei]|uniref:Protein SGT1 homolog n=1 Tax=Hypothenemus hampei TaxID=57062 RepID=A0ABD1ETS4_HYPHA
MTDHNTAETKATLEVKHDWYQSDSMVVITVLVKNVPEDQAKITFSEERVHLVINLTEFQEYSKAFQLAHKIVPEYSGFKITPSKIEIKLKKSEGIRWEKLEGECTNNNIKTIPQETHLGGDRPPSYPTSKKGKDWNKVEKEIKKQEEEEKPEGDAALQKLFQDLYGRSSDEVRKAMNKSFMESGGTVLSTNWNEVSKKKVEVKPPDGVEFKKWDS